MEVRRTAHKHIFDPGTTIQWCMECEAYVKLTKISKRIAREQIVRSHAPTHLQALVDKFPNCYYCGKKLTVYTITRDHKTPRSRGGRGSGNIVGACWKCNNVKGDMTEWEFRRRIENEAR